MTVTQGVLCGLFESFVYFTETLPCAEFLDVIFARNVATKRRKDELLRVEVVTEVVKLETRRYILVKLFLGSAYLSTERQRDLHGQKS